MWAGAIE
jgi:hypothetical protein